MALCCHWLLRLQENARLARLANGSHIPIDPLDYGKLGVVNYSSMSVLMLQIEAIKYSHLETLYSLARTTPS